MRFSERKQYALVALVVFLIYDLILKPVLLINVENLADKFGYAYIVAKNVEVGESKVFLTILQMTLTSYYDILSSGMLFAFILGGVVVAFSDWIFLPLTHVYRAISGRPSAPLVGNDTVNQSRHDRRLHSAGIAQQSPRPLAVESDEDKDAKDRIVHFCRAHLFELIEQERRSINEIIEELFGDPDSSLVGRYATKSIREEFSVEPRIVAATKDAAYRNSQTKIQLEALLAEANAFVVRRSIFISQAIRERGFDDSKAMSIAQKLYRMRESTKAAWEPLAANPIFDTFQTSFGKRGSAWGDLWLPAVQSEPPKR